MDKRILIDYIDACKIVEETKEEIRKLKKNRKRILTDTVKGSSHDFITHFRHIGQRDLPIQ